MRLHRGIAVPAAIVQQTIDDIRNKGLVQGQGRWTMLAADLKPRLAELWRLSGIGDADISAEVDAAEDSDSWICAADQLGAKYYASCHNLSSRDDTPLMITFDADPVDVIVDGRDFLFALFQLGEPARARPLAERLFGPAIRPYVERAWSTNDQSRRIAICKIAVQDEAIIADHASNTSIIGGRHQTRFCSAFLVRGPITADRIVDVCQIDPLVDIPEPDVTLDMIR